MSDVFQLLKADHNEVEGMLTELTGPSSADGGRGQMAERLVMDESKHEAAEEMYFWPTVRDRVTGGGSLADEALRQESEGKEVLDKLRKSSPDDREFGELIATFATAARAHIRFEEQQVWPELQRVLTQAERDELGERFQSAKERGPTRPHPNAPDSPGALKTVGTAAAMMDKARDAATGRGEGG